MNNLKLILNSGLFFSILLISIASCKSGADSEAKVEPKADSATASKSQSEPAAIIAGKLDTLWATKDQFLALDDKKLVLVFTFGNADTLTMHGWSFRGAIGHADFDSLPDIRLTKGLPSILDYGPGTYFGNEVLMNVKEVKRAIRTNMAEFVVFAPEKNGEHIKHNVFVSKEPPLTLIKKFALIPTNQIANPSPPKNQ